MEPEVSFTSILHPQRSETPRRVVGGAGRHEPRRGTRLDAALGRLPGAADAVPRGEEKVDAQCVTRGPVPGPGVGPESLGVGVSGFLHQSPSFLRDQFQGVVHGASG